MARRSETAARLEALSRTLQQTRLDLGTAALATRRRLDVHARLQTAVRHHPGRWFAGAVGVGLLASLLRRRPKSAATTPPPSSRPMALAAAGFLGSLFRPALTEWVTRQLRRRL